MVKNEGLSAMKDPVNNPDQLKQKVLDKIGEYDGEIVLEDSSLIKAIFPENKMEQAVRVYFEITEKLDQKAELSGGSRLTVFWDWYDRFKAGVLNKKIVLVLKNTHSAHMQKLAVGWPMSLNTRIWQEGHRKTIFRFQTQDENVHIFLSQRKDFRLVGWGVNINLWIYMGEFNSLRRARETLRPAYPGGWRGPLFLEIKNG